MKIGIDLRVLQIGHQYRGIGEVAKQCLNRMFELSSESKTEEVAFVFYLYSLSDGEMDPKDLLIIPPTLRYEEVDLGIQPARNNTRTIANKLYGKFQRLFGDPLPQAASCDIFLQFDYALGIPKKCKTLLVAHDIIPYIFWDDYHVSFWTCLRQGSVNKALRAFVSNFEYTRILKRSFKRAARVVCVSNNTRDDLQQYLHVASEKLRVVHLGVSNKLSRVPTAGTTAHRPTKPYLLFIGDVDKRRRRVDDIVTAYNKLKGDGFDIQLVLAGNNFESLDKIEKILDPTVSKAITDSSYADDILLLGYVDDQTKRQLYRHAVAFVFPTVYEGFGIPILEAMLWGAPVITYRNSSISEVAGDFALYAKNWEDIYEQVVGLMAMSPPKRLSFVANGTRHARSFTWDSTAERIYKELLAA